MPKMCIKPDFSFWNDFLLEIENSAIYVDHVHFILKYNQLK